MYDPRIARFPSADPIIVKQGKYPELSSYQYASNTPIMAVDLDGLEAQIVMKNVHTNGKTSTRVINDRKIIELMFGALWDAWYKARFSKNHNDWKEYKKHWRNGYNKFLPHSGRKAPETGALTIRNYKDGGYSYDYDGDDEAARERANRRMWEGVKNRAEQLERWGTVGEVFGYQFGFDDITLPAKTLSIEGSLAKALANYQLNNDEIEATITVGEVAFVEVVGEVSGKQVGKWAKGTKLGAKETKYLMNEPSKWLGIFEFSKGIYEEKKKK